MTPSVSVVIPTHDRASALAVTLDELAATDPPIGLEVEVVIVANACTDDTVQVVETRIGDFPFSLRVVEEPRAGLNVARNRGLEETSGRYVALLDDDVSVDRGWLRALEESFRGEGADVLAGRVTLFWEAGTRPDWAPPVVDKLLSSLDLGDAEVELEEATLLVGANFAFRREVAHAIGGFLPTLDRAGASLLSGGDTEFVSRALAAGARLLYVPHLAVLHRIPPYRVSHSYLDRLARGRGETGVMLARERRTLSVPKLLRSAARQIVVGGAREVRSWLAGERQRVVEGRLYRMRGWGMALGTLRCIRERGRDD